MKKQVVSLALSVFIVTVMLVGLGLAQMSPHGLPGKGQSGMPPAMGHKGSPMMGGAPHGPDHAYGSSWRKSLSDKQKKKADQMHLELKKEISGIAAAKELKLAELKLLVVQDRPDMQAVEVKIGEILDLKRQIMIKRYAHKVEMRAMLTPEQRVSFDMGMLSGSPHGK